MFSRSRTVMRIGGIPVSVDASWFLVLLLLTWSFWGRFRTGPPGHPGGEALVMAILGTALFSLSVLAHEAAHALEAKHRGIHVGGITLYVFGGATEILSEEVRRPGDEFALTVVGPWTSFVLGSLFGLISFFGARLNGPLVAEIFGQLGWLNVILAIFNLLPGAPLDGGRIVEAIAWRVTKDRLRATRIAARAGRVIGALVVALGLWELIFVPGGLTGGLWLALLGGVMSQAAAAEEFQAEIRAVLAHIPVGRIVAPPVLVPADAPLTGVIEQQLGLYLVDAVLVVDGVTPVGVLTLDDVRRVPAVQWAHMPAGSAARPIAELPHLEADQPAASALSLAAEGPVLVTQEGVVVGVVTARSLLAAAQRARELSRVLVPVAPVGRGGPIGGPGA